MKQKVSARELRGYCRANNLHDIQFHMDGNPVCVDMVFPAIEVFWNPNWIVLKSMYGNIVISRVMFAYIEESYPHGIRITVCCGMMDEDVPEVTYTLLAS